MHCADLGWGSALLQDVKGWPSLFNKMAKNTKDYRSWETAAMLVRTTGRQMDSKGLHRIEFE